MIISTCRDQAARVRQDYATPHGARVSVETYMGTNQMLLAAGAARQAAGTLDAATTYPMAHLVSQSPGSTVNAHYHQADQFQVFVGGSGRIGVHPLEPLTVHFAGAHSPYGPLVAGEHGLQYLTLRRSWDPGAQWMPESAPTLRQMAARKHRARTSPTVGADGPLPQEAGTCRVTCLIGEGSMGAWLIELGPGAEYAAASAVDRFVFVHAGAACCGPTLLPAGSCLFASADETRVPFSAGAQGARMVLAQFDAAPS